MYWSVLRFDLEAKRVQTGPGITNASFTGLNLEGSVRSHRQRARAQAQAVPRDLIEAGLNEAAVSWGGLWE
jgi:hypothetical protein